MREKISAWLTCPMDYQTGLALLKQTGFSGYTLGILSMGEDRYNRDRLKIELRKWLESPNKIIVSTAAASSTPKEVSVSVARSKPDVKPQTVVEISDNSLAEKVSMSEISTTPDEVQQLQLRSRQLMDERVEVKAKLRVFASLDDEANQQTARDAAFRVKAITRELDELFSQLDFYKQYGYLPPLAEDPSIVVDDQAKLLNVRTYVSLYKKQVREAKTDEKKLAAQKLLASYEAEKIRLETKLGLTKKSHAV